MLSITVRELRKSRSWSQAQLAERARVSQQLIAKIERGKVSESRKLPRIAQAFGMTVEQLLGIAQGSRTGTASIPMGDERAKRDWPFSFARERFDKLRRDQKLKVEGAALMVILEIETHQNAGQKRRNAG